MSIYENPICNSASHASITSRKDAISRTLPEAEEANVEAFMKYLLECEKTKNTREAYRNSIKAFFSEYEELSKENMIDFKEKEIEYHKPRTAALRVVAMNQYCDFIGKPMCKVKRVKIYGENSVENIPTREEYLYFLNCLKEDGHEKMYWMLRFFAATGARASELVKLDKSCLRTGEASMQTKGKVRRILIPSSLIKESRYYFESVDSRYLFPAPGGRRMQPQSISKMMRRYGEKYKLRLEILHPHAYRHLFAMLFLESNGNLTLLSNLLGHESVRTTAIYLQMSTEKQKEELDKAVCW